MVASGKKRGMDVTILGIAVAFAFFFVGANLRSLNTLSLILVLPLGAWVYLVVPWRARIEETSYEANKRGMYKALWIWALTDLTLVVWALAGST